jgi:hypothetical protein
MARPHAEPAGPGRQGLRTSERRRTIGVAEPVAESAGKLSGAAARRRSPSSWTGAGRDETPSHSWFGEPPLGHRRRAPRDRRPRAGRRRRPVALLRAYRSLALRGGVPRFPPGAHHRGQRRDRHRATQASRARSRTGPPAAARNGRSDLDRFCARSPPFRRWIENPLARELKASATRRSRAGSD